jgi:hypothetical protein
VEEAPQEGAEGTERSVAADGIPNLPPELSTKEQELRALIDAGASSPEELRELAAKLKEQRSYERSVWQQEVRPALMQAKKRRFNLLDLRNDTTEEERGNHLALGALLAVAMLVLIVLAANTSFIILLIAPVAVLVYAWMHGREGGPGAGSPPPTADG